MTTELLVPIMGEKIKGNNTKTRAKMNSFHIRGTTFSGHPTRTTLGNTLRTILYTEYYLRGINHEVVVAGDDCVVFCERKDASKVEQKIFQYTSLSSDKTVSKGLG